MSKAVRVPESEHGINPQKIEKKAKIILQALTKAGYEAYLVGGAVRDLLLGLRPKDFDIATSATPEQVKRVLPSTRIIGRRFRLAHVHFGYYYYEVATFRAPHDKSDKGKTSNDGRITHDNVYGTLEEDAFRRDFTINALFYDLKTAEVIDFTGGVKDLAARQLRMIGDPVTRYREDPVRMIRAIRFSNKLGLKIESKTKEPIYQLSHLLGSIAPARLFEEVLKLFHSGNAWAMLEASREFGLFEHLFPIAEKSLQEDSDGVYTQFVKIALANTDKRIKAGLPITPAFLFAVLLWKKVEDGATLYKELGNPTLQSVHLASNDVFSEQVKTISIPRRFSTMAREIWTMQGRFQFKNHRRVVTFLGNKRFRASYDFMCLRAKSGQLPKEECEWWTLIQEVDAQEKINMCQAVTTSSKNTRNNKRRKKKT